MEIKPDTLQVRDVYKLLVGSVVPRPIAWVTTVGAGRLTNAAPFSYFNAVASNPPTLAVSFSWNPATEDHQKDTYRNILDSGECVVNTVNEALAQAMNASATDYPRSMSELEQVGIETVASRTVSAPRIAGAPVCFECGLDRTVEIGTGPGGATLTAGSATLVLLSVRHIFVDDALIDDDFHIDIRAYRPVGRLAGSEYCTVHDVFEMRRQSYADMSESE